MARNPRSVQIVSASFGRVASLRARGLEGGVCACAADGCDGIRGAAVMSWRNDMAWRGLYECEVCTVLRWLRWCRLGLPRLWLVLEVGDP